MIDDTIATYLVDVLVDFAKYIAKRAMLPINGNGWKKSTLPGVGIAVVDFEHRAALAIEFVGEHVFLEPATSRREGYRYPAHVRIPEFVECPGNM